MVIIKTKVTVPLFSAAIKAADIAKTGRAEINPVTIPFFLFGLTDVKPAQKAAAAKENMDKKGSIHGETLDFTIIIEKIDKRAHRVTSSAAKAKI